MGINLDKMREKLAALRGEGKGGGLSLNNI